MECFLCADVSRLFKIQFHMNLINFVVGIDFQFEFMSDLRYLLSQLSNCLILMT